MQNRNRRGAKKWNWEGDKRKKARTTQPVEKGQRDWTEGQTGGKNVLQLNRAGGPGKDVRNCEPGSSSSSDPTFTTLVLLKQSGRREWSHGKGRGVEKEREVPIDPGRRENLRREDHVCHALDKKGAGRVPGTERRRSGRTRGPEEAGRGSLEPRQILNKKKDLSKGPNFAARRRGYAR